MSGGIDYDEGYEAGFLAGQESEYNLRVAYKIPVDFYTAGKRRHSVELSLHQDGAVTWRDR